MKTNSVKRFRRGDHVRLDIAGLRRFTWELYDCGYADWWAVCLHAPFPGDRRRTPSGGIAISEAEIAILV